MILGLWDRNSIVNALRQPFKRHYSLKKKGKKKINPLQNILKLEGKDEVVPLAQFSQRKVFPVKKRYLDINNLLHKSPSVYALRGRNSLELLLSNAINEGYILNAVRVILVKKPFNAMFFRKALKAAQEMYPCLYVSLIKQHGDLKFHVPQNITVKYQHNDMCNDPEQWKYETEKLLNTPFEVDVNESQMKVLSITSINGHTRIIFCFNQLMVDELTINCIINDIFDIYIKQLEGAIISPRDPQPSILNFDNVIPKEELKGLFRYRLRNFLSLYFNKFDRITKSMDAANSRTTTSSIFYIIDRERVLYIRRKCLENNISVNAYIASVALVATKLVCDTPIKNESKLLLYSSFDIRNLFNPPISNRVSANLSVGRHFEVKVSGSDTVWDIATNIDNLYSNFLNSSDVFHAWFQQPSHDSFFYSDKKSNKFPSIVIHPIGAIDLNKKAMKILDIDTRDFHILRSNYSKTFSIVAYDISGELHLTITFQLPIINEYKAAKFAGILRSIIEKG